MIPFTNVIIRSIFITLIRFLLNLIAILIKVICQLIKFNKDFLRILRKN